MRRLLLLRHLGLRCPRMSRKNRAHLSVRLPRRRRKSERLPNRRQSVDLSERLPLELIMKHLPLRQRVQALCVCKAWNHILRDSVVAEMEEMQKGPWLLMAQYFTGTGWDLMAYKSTGALAHPCLLPSGNDAFGACVVGGPTGLLMGCKCFSEDYLWDLYMPRLASSGGLMCALLTADAYHVNGNVVVFNCLTGSVKVLPPPLRLDPLFKGWDLYSDASLDPCPCYTYMAVDDLDPTRYYIMLTRVRECCETGFTDDARHMEVFDSKIWGWIDATIPDEFRLPHWGNVWDADFFFIREYYGEIFCLAGYSVARDVWSMQQLPRECSRYMDCDESLFIHKFEGRLFLAIHHLSTPHRLCIWEVRQTASRDAVWVEISSTPPQISSDIKSRTKDCNCGLQACGSCFYFIIYVKGFSVREIPPLVFDIVSNSWYFLPVKDWCSNYHCALVHQPSLSARI